MPRITEQQRQDAIAKLREYLRPGDNVTTTVMHVSRSGMYRAIKCQIVSRGEILDISWLVARATGFGFDERHGGVKASGCGMDMTFHVVYSLSSALWPDGYRCTSRTRNGRPVCRSNDHSNGLREYDGRTIKHQDGGYALLNNRW